MANVALIIIIKRNDIRESKEKKRE